MNLYYCNECPNQSYAGTLRKAASHFADIIAKRLHGETAGCFRLTQVICNRDTATYEATVGTWDSQAGYFVGPSVLFVLTENRETNAEAN